MGSSRYLMLVRPGRFFLIRDSYILIQSQLQIDIILRTTQFNKTFRPYLLKMKYSGISILILTLVSLAGCQKSNDSEIENSKPEGNRFSHVVVADGLNEPMQIEFDQSGYVYWIERTGSVKRLFEETGEIDELGEVDLMSGYYPGLIGLLLDRDFEDNRQIYLYYSASADDGKMRLSRFTINSDNRLDPESEVVMLRIPWRLPDGQHIGGGMVYDKEGNILLSVGDSTSPSQFEPIHHRDDGTIQDAAATAGNTNDLRGSILRITPQPDGTYTIPDGNLFPEGTEKTRPEIYIMGSRNPWRLSIDSKTGYLHWGEVGPDSGADSDVYGPAGVDVLNIAPNAGNYGWPFVYGNRPYPQYNYETGEYGDPHNPDGPINSSPNNTGLLKLPAVEQTIIAYPYGVYEEWPIFGSAGRSIVGGPIFRKDDFNSDSPDVFPDYFEGKWFITDYVRNWILVITLSEDRKEVLDVEHFLPPNRLSHSQPLDMDFSPSGNLYMIEYGSSGQGRVSRYEYNDGNRAPIASADAEVRSGSIPFELTLNSDGTIDYDGDELDYEWIISKISQTGTQAATLTGPNPVYVIEEAGRYRVDLIVTDPFGEDATDTFEVVAGNERPDVTLSLNRGNKSFYFPDEEIQYELSVTDHEDGNLRDGELDPDRIDLTAEYIPAGLTTLELSDLIQNGDVVPGEPVRFVQSKALIEQYNCTTCHGIERGIVGPSFTEIAEENEGRDERDRIANTIIEGSSGSWGEIPMPPNPMVSQSEAQQIAEFILGLTDTDSQSNNLPLSGTYKTTVHERTGGSGRLGRFYSIPYQRGSYLFHASYTDRGTDRVEGLELTGEDFILLRYPLMAPEEADYFSEKGISYTPSTSDPGFIVSGKAPYIGFEQIDLSGISQIKIGALTRFWHWSHFKGANVELRLGSPDGPLVGESHPQFRPEHITPEDGPFFAHNWDDPVEVDVSDIDGNHDIYILFKNPDAEDEDALLTITGIEFIKQ